MPVPCTRPWRSYDDLGPDATHELIRTLTEISATHRADLRAQSAQDRSHIAHLLVMQQLRIEAKVSHELHRLMLRTYEAERNRPDPMLWILLAAPLAVVLLVAALCAAR